MCRPNLNLFSRVACFIFLLPCLEIAHSLSFDEEKITLTPKEKVALEDIKRLMIPKIPQSSYVYKFAKDDLYLLKWLQVAELWISEWNVRQAVLTGTISKLTRLLTYCMESQTRLLFEARAQGSNVTQGTLLVDLEGVNLIQHICPNCLPVYLTMTTNLETHYPFIWNRLYLLNMPAHFEIILRLVRPAMRKSTRDAMKTYLNKEQWIPLLDEVIDKNQRSLRFGGTLNRE
ncbi:unnamed protein product [Orchesella dallaii]|uniref:CRAL-TRIO domain-containing protein n=1 Tax=Orchesella dallaii TaxID=48710 RepID=A0ABP1PLC2_9HEXA